MEKLVKFNINLHKICSKAGLTYSRVWKCVNKKYGVRPLSEDERKKLKTAIEEAAKEDLARI